MIDAALRWDMREASPLDAAEIAGVQLQTWYETYSSLLPSEHMDIWTEAQLTHQWQDFCANRTVLVASDNGRIIGFCCGSAAGRTDAPSGQAELSMLYIIRQYQGLGIGSALLNQMINLLALEGFNSLETWVLNTNRRARYFYERQGGFYFTRAHVVFEGLSLQETGYMWPAIAPDITPIAKPFANDPHSVYDKPLLGIE